jgi:hypothetical protein
MATQQKTFYIKYKDNQPVKIDTKYAKRPDGGPVEDVGDLIAAFFPSAEPATLGQYTLHLTTDSEALEPDKQLSEITSGMKAKNPLMIKATESSSSSKSSPIDSELLTQVNNTVKNAFGSVLNVIKPLVEEYSTKFYYGNNAATKSAKRDPQFKIKLLEYYQNIEQAEPVQTIVCMITGYKLPSQYVIASHLFKREWGAHCHRLGFSDIDDVRNGLLMFKPFEHAFDNAHMHFLYDMSTRELKMRILDPELFNLTLGAYLEREKKIKGIPSREQWEAMHANTPESIKTELTSAYASMEQLLRKTFREFHNKPVAHRFKEGRNVYRRCLSFQMGMAMRQAVDMKWITAEEATSPSEWSDLAEDKKKQIMTWIDSHQLSTFDVASPVESESGYD